MVDLTSVSTSTVSVRLMHINLRLDSICVAELARRPRLPFSRPCWSLFGGLEIGCVDHDGLLFTVRGHQTRHYPGEDALIAPPLPAIVECLVGAIGCRRITPSQAVAIDEDNPLNTRRSSMRVCRVISGGRAQGAPSAHPLARKGQICSPLDFRTVNHDPMRKSRGP